MGYLAHPFRQGARSHKHSSANVGFGGLAIMLPAHDAKDLALALASSALGPQSGSSIWTLANAKATHYRVGQDAGQALPAAR